MNPINLAMTGYVVETNGQRRQHPIPVPVTLGYDPDEDPLVVGMLFENVIATDDNEQVGVTWELGRQLLADAVDSNGERVGLGDVKIKKQVDMLILCLKNPNGHAHLALPLAEVKGFVMETILSAPLGSECLDGQIDEFLKELFEA